MKPDASSDSWPSYYVTPNHNVDRYACLPTYLPHLHAMKALDLQAVQITGMYCNSCSMYYMFYILWYLYYTSHFLTCCMTTFVHVIVMTKCFRVFVIFGAHIHLYMLTLLNLRHFHILRMTEGLDNCLVQLCNLWWRASKTQNM